MLTGTPVYSKNVTTNEVSHYIGGGGVRLQVKNGTPSWTHLDHQGSAVAATNGSGAKLWEERYLPFGEKLIDPSANQDRPGYTGHVQDSWSGLTYMQARYYDPVLGRFMQTDPIGYRDQLNLYAYVHNDPVNLVDPDGLESWKVDKEVLRQVIGAREDFKQNYNDMRKSRTQGADKFFHCKANCQATRRGPEGEREAINISNLRELVDQITGDPPQDSIDDQAANLSGREGAKSKPELSCSAVCSEYIVSPMNDNGDFTEGIPDTINQSEPEVTSEQKELE